MEKELCVVMHANAGGIIVDLCWTRDELLRVVKNLKNNGFEFTVLQVTAYAEINYDEIDLGIEAGIRDVMIVETIKFPGEK